MGRRTLLIVLIAFLAILFAPSAEAATPIPGTPLNVVDLGPSSQVVPLGSVTNFSCGIYNGGPPP